MSPLTDVLLLLIVLFGLLRMCLDAGGAFGFGSSIGIRCSGGSSPCFQSTNVRPIRKGLIWLFLPTVAQVPTSMRLSIFLSPFFLLIAILPHRRFCF